MPTTEVYAKEFLDDRYQVTALSEVVELVIFSTIPTTDGTGGVEMVGTGYAPIPLNEDNMAVAVANSQGTGGQAVSTAALGWTVGSGWAAQIVGAGIRRISDNVLLDWYQFPTGPVSTPLGAIIQFPVGVFQSVMT